MENFFIEKTTRIKVTSQDIDDIMASALEGGITYWCYKAKVVGEYLGEYASEQISHNGVLLLYDNEDCSIYELTLEKFLNGITKAITENYFVSYEWFNDKEIDTCQVDAEVADCIVQLALFGDVIYG